MRPNAVTFPVTFPVTPSEIGVTGSLVYPQVQFIIFRNDKVIILSPGASYYFIPRCKLLFYPQVQFIIRLHWA